MSCGPRCFWAAAAATLAYGASLRRSPPARGEPPDRCAFAGDGGPVENVALTTHEGRAVRFYDDLLQGKTVLLHFFYTVCTAEAICPLATANLVEVQRLLGPRAGKDIFLYSITLDPENDTPGVLKSYAKAFGAGGMGISRAEGRSNAAAQLGYEPRSGEGLGPSCTAGCPLRIELLERWAACPILTCRSRPRYLAWLEPGRKAEPGRLKTPALDSPRGDLTMGRPTECSLGYRAQGGL
jgi:protein SCO1/2